MKLAFCDGLEITNNQKKKKEKLITHDRYFNTVVLWDYETFLEK